MICELGIVNLPHGNITLVIKWKYLPSVWVHCLCASEFLISSGDSGDDCAVSSTFTATIVFKSLIHIL